jgi:hypothetical protein
MATERQSMRQTREILRHKWVLGRSHRQVARSLGISNGAVGTTVGRARTAGLDWPQVEALSDLALEARLYGRPEVAGARARPQPDCVYLHAERRKPGVTLELLHLEYLCGPTSTPGVCGGIRPVARSSSTGSIGPRFARCLPSRLSTASGRSRA